ncbi:MAG: diheme cytochrome c [Gammaproteobacteria bacterium]|nr:diheme cytochrome c [Gammaproteobacteria bacterium]
MNKSLIMTAATVLATVLIIPVVFSDDDRHAARQHSLGVAPVVLDAYKNECSSCHMAYPPGLLPASSWQKIMTGLDAHFSDNAELDSESYKIISDFLLSNSADNSDYRRSRKIMRSLNTGDAPLRISELPYIKREHHELPDKMIKFNPKVNSLANCIACHTDAEKGLFNEHQVNIPGYGRWDD